jgi:hypothetical protein
VRIGSQSRIDGLDSRWCERTDEYAFANSLEEPRERVCTGLRGTGTRDFDFGDAFNGKPLSEA